jgi:hypothetical protein
MSSLREAEKLLADLPENSPGKALEEIVTWIESVSATPGYKPELRATILRLLEDTGLRFEETVLNQYLAEARIHDHRSRDRCQKSLAFRAALSEAYLACLVDDFGVETETRSANEEDLMSVLCRGMRSTAMQEKVRHLNYQGVDNEIWGRLYRYYRVAEGQPREAQRRKTEQADDAAAGTAAAAAAGDRRARVARARARRAGSRMVARIANTFSITNAPSAANPYCIDLMQPAAPFQYGDAPPEHRPRAISAPARNGPPQGDARPRGGNPLPGDRRKARVSRWDIVRVLKHLLLYWGPDRPFRLNKRTRAQGKIYILHSLDAIRRVVIQVGTDQFAAIEATYAERATSCRWSPKNSTSRPRFGPRRT